MQRFHSLVVGSVVVVRRALGDIVDAKIVVGFVAPILVVLVKTTYRTLLDRTPWTAIRFLSRRLAFVLWRRVGPEIAIARRWR